MKIFYAALMIGLIVALTMIFGAKFLVLLGGAFIIVLAIGTFFGIAHLVPSEDTGDCVGCIFTVLPLGAAFLVLFLGFSVLPDLRSPVERAEDAENAQTSRKRTEALWGIESKTSSEATPDLRSETPSSSSDDLSPGYQKNIDASSWNGDDWIAADRQTRWNLSQKMADGIQSSAPGISGEFLFDALNEFYDSPDSSSLEVKINIAVGMIAVGYMAEQ